MKKITSLILSAVLLIVAAPQSVDASPEVSARSAILIRADTNEVIFEKNADEVLPMASTTKIMTALIAIERLSLDDEVTVTAESAGTEGTSLYLSDGDVLTVRDLLFATMLRSANDAASALAVHTAGSEEAFAVLMNEKASELGLSSTHFTNPHGLPDEGHYTTARELALFASYAMESETFRDIAGTRKYTVTVNGTDKREVTNHNRLLFSYDGATGVKTGYTKSSGRCLVSSAEREGFTLIAVTLDAPDDWRDHARMLDAGFAYLDRICPAE